MSSLSRWPLFRSCLAGMMSRGSGWLVLAGLPLFAWLMPLLAPWEENPQILQPARAQAAWIYAWLALFTWLPFQAAVLGSRLRSEGVLEHQRAAGTGVFSLCLQLTSALAVWLLALALLAMLVCDVACLPRRPEEARLWVQLAGQYAALYSLSGVPLLWLGVAVATRTSEVVAFLLPVTLLFLGLFGAVWLVPLLGGPEADLARQIWLLLPHHHLADLTPRLVFKMGPLPAADFTATLGILGLQGGAFSLIGLWLFRTRS